MPSMQGIEKKNRLKRQTSIYAQRPHRGFMRSTNRSEQADRQRSKLKDSQSFLSSYETCSSSSNRGMRKLCIGIFWNLCVFCTFGPFALGTVSVISRLNRSPSLAAEMHSWLCDQFYFRIAFEIWIDWYCIFTARSNALINGINNVKNCTKKKKTFNNINQMDWRKSAYLQTMSRYYFISLFSWHKCNKNVRNTIKIDWRTCNGVPEQFEMVWVD